MQINELKKTDLLYADIERRIDRIHRKKNLYVNIHKFTKVTIFCSGVVITILTGWAFNIRYFGPYNFNPNSTVLVTSVMITLLAALEAVFSFKDKAMSYDLFLYDLRKIRDKIAYDFDRGNYDSERKDKHFDAFQRILESKKGIIEGSFANDD